MATLLMPSYVGTVGKCVTDLQASTPCPLHWWCSEDWTAGKNTETSFRSQVLHMVSSQSSDFLCWLVTCFLFHGSLCTKWQCHNLDPRRELVWLLWKFQHCICVQFQAGIGVRNLFFTDNHKIVCLHQNHVLFDSYYLPFKLIHEKYMPSCDGEFSGLYISRVCLL